MWDVTTVAPRAVLLAALALGCGSVTKPELPSDDAATDAGSGADAVIVGPDATRAPGCPGDFFGPCSDDGKVCTYTEHCALPTFFVYTVTCRKRVDGTALAWVITEDRECYRVNNAQGCPLGGAMDRADCDPVGLVCAYPVQCAKKTEYQVARCVLADTGFGVWKTEATRPCGT